MLDYQAIAALSAIIETQSFQKGAAKLFITQSAISQRVKSLENFYGQPLLIRSLPYRPTKLGMKLLEHFRHITLLEDALDETLFIAEYKPKISIAISHDSLDTWFISVMDHLKSIMPLTLEIIADDQDITLSYLQKGLVSACASMSKKTLLGCKAEFLGYLDYALVASSEFKNRYFNNNKTKENLIKAPAVIFDNKDTLHTKYLKHYFNIDDIDIQYHCVPSVAGFRQFAVSGYAYALIPKIDILDELRQHKLINLFPDKIWAMPVYWHSWKLEAKGYKKFNELVLKIGSKILRQ